MNDMSRNVDAVILTYHSISQGPAPLCISPEVFAAQMHWLKSQAHVMPLELLAESLAHGRRLPPRTVALTFDDGFSDFHSEAAPTLRRLELTATVFLPASYCGRVSSWDPQAGKRPLMTWTEIRELASQGVNIGSHGMSHRVLTGRTDAELAYEMAESKSLIEAETGQEVRFFCYPYGSNNDRTRRAVSACYSGGACSTDLRILASAEDRFALPRIDVHYLRSFLIFQSMFTKRFRFYICARRIARNFDSWIRPAKQQGQK
jgi:peptidoglycan/xylan/chitin deacetylase (PgdA/CDA1 family)